MIKNQEDKILAISNPDKTCCRCLGEFDNLKKIHIGALGYGSGFDNNSTQINLCDDCIKYTNKDWWKLKTKVAFSHGEYDFECYEYEDEIFNFVKSLPLAGQELFWNRYSTDNYTLDSQDWIDYELDILPHEKCKEYGMYSPQERRAYQERFPICGCVQFIIYNDGSQGCHCPFGAFGNKDGTAEGHQTQSKCYECDKFELRQGEIMTVELKEEEIKRTQDQLDRLRKKLKELQRKD